MGPPGPKEVVRDTARDLAGLASDLNRTNGDALHWLTGQEYSHAPAPTGGRARCRRGGADRGQEAGAAERGAGTVSAATATLYGAIIAGTFALLGVLVERLLRSSGRLWCEPCGWEARFYAETMAVRKRSCPPIRRIGRNAQNTSSIWTYSTARRFR